MMRVVLFCLFCFSMAFGQEIGKPFVQVGHTHHVNTLAISPDGKTLASGSKDNTIKLWDIKNKRLITTFIGHKRDIYSVQFSPDGKTLASGSRDNTIKLWDIKNKRLITTFIGHKDIVNSVSFSPDGKTLASGSWDSDIKLWNMVDYTLIKTLKGKKSRVGMISFSPDGKTLASGYWDNNIKLWSVKNYKVLKIFKGHKDWINCIAFSPNGRVLASAGDDRTIKLWNMKNKRLIKTLKVSKSSINAISFSSDGNILAIGDDSSTIKLWGMKKNKVLNILKESSIYPVESLLFYRENKFLISGGENIQFWEIEKRNSIKKLTINNIHVNTVAFNNDGNTLALGLSNGEIKLWDNLEQSLLGTIKASTQPITTISFSPDGKILASGSWGSRVKLWDTISKKKIGTFVGHSDVVNTVLFSPDGKTLASGSRDKTVKIWEVNNKKLLYTLKNYHASVTTLSFNKNGKLLAYGGRNYSPKKQKIIIWDMVKKKIDYELMGHEGAITKIKFMPTDDFVVSSSLDKTIKVWNINTHKLVETIKNHNAAVSDLGVTTDNKVISVFRDTIILITDIRSKESIEISSKHTDWINSIAISKRNIFITCSEDGTNKLWDIKTQKELLSFSFFDNDEWIAITPEGYYSASKNGAKHLNVLTGPMTVTSVDAYAEKFYRPDIVKLAMQGKKVDTGVKMSDIKPAPEVSMSGVPQNTDKKQVEVTLSIKDMGGGIGDVRIYRNGTAVALKSRDMQRSQKNMQYMTFVVPLQKGKNELKAIAFESTNSLRSEPAITTVTTTYVEKTKPSLHAVIIGIEKFRNSRLNLMYTKSDAIVLSDTIEQYAKRLFTSVNVTLLTSKDETSKENITKVLESLQNLNPHDMFLLFIASHGTVDMGDYYLITSNVGSTRTKKLKQDALSQAEITKLISNIPTSKKLIVLDTCHAGALGTSLNRALLNRGMSEDTAIKILSRATGTTILSASLSTQQALEGYKGHGLFSHVLLDGLKGKADFNRDGFVKTTELYDYINDTVPELSQKVFGVEQFPTANLNGRSFPISKVGK